MAGDRQKSDEKEGDEKEVSLSSHHPLELSGLEFWRMVEQSAARISTFLDTLPDQPAGIVENPAGSWIEEPLPREGVAFEQLLRELFDQVFPAALNTAGPGYLGYIPGGGLPHAAIADLVSMIANRYVGLSMAAPAAARIEANVVRWFCDILGYSSTSGGFMTTGGSLANWAALVVARQTRMADNFRNGMLYTSDQAHHSVAKAAMLAGFPRGNVRSIRVDRQYRLNIKALKKLVLEDRREGRIPLAIVAHAGTTNTGAVDDLESAADLSAEENIWLHVDAAYGGFFMLTERGRAIMQGIHRADSVTLDPHKGLFLPYGTGSLLVRERQWLHQTFAWRGDYMTAVAAEQGAPDFCDISPELSRGFRGLRVWLPVKMHGIRPFQQCLDEKLDLAAYAAKQLGRIPHLRIVAAPQLSVVPFRIVPQGASVEELNELNRRLLQRINASGRVFLSPTVLDGCFVLRMCILSFRTHRDRIDECLEIIRQAAASLT